MRWSVAGQPDHLVFAGMRGGGGKGGGGSTQAPAPVQPTILTDPVTGKSFVQAMTTDAWGNQTPDTSKPSAMDQLNAEIDQRNAAAAAQTTQNTQAATDTAATNEANFQTSKQAAYNSALQQTIRTFQLQGLDPNKYMDSDIVPALQGQMNTIQDLSPNPSAAFSSDLGSNIINNITSGQRTQNLNAVNSIFSPTYDTTALPDSTVSQYVDPIVAQQFDPLSQQLTYAQKRGTLTDQGYQAAVAALTAKKAAATSQVTSLGQNILNTDRSSLDDYIGTARSDANASTPTSGFDPNAYSTTAQGKVATDLGGFQGALQNAVGDTQFANISDLLNAGGTAQGVTNPNAANPTDASGGSALLSPSAISEQALATQPRGLGSQGAF